ncbi:ciliary microtubule associated protein 1B [Pholidichthys leucotaenia]
MSSAEPWVGTWRPHKPRGPIAALYGSPGPKYALPGLTGHYSPERSERSVFHSAPAYSLSGWCREGAMSQTPGPATYCLPAVLGSNSVAMPSAPRYSLYERRKIGGFYEDLKKTPGPATYNAVDPNIIQKKSPHYSITFRHFQTKEHTTNPGPGAYRAELVNLTRAKAPSFSFGLHHSQYVSPLIVHSDK